MRRTHSPHNLQLFTKSFSINYRAMKNQFTRTNLIARPPVCRAVWVPRARQSGTSHLNFCNLWPRKAAFVASREIGKVDPNPIRSFVFSHSLAAFWFTPEGILPFEFLESDREAPS